MTPRYAEYFHIILVLLGRIPRNPAAKHHRILAIGKSRSQLDSGTSKPRAKGFLIRNPNLI